MQHTFSLTHTAGIVLELQMGDQVFHFLSSFKACFKLRGLSRKHIRFLVEYIQFISVNVRVDDLPITQSSQITYFRRMKRQQKQAKGCLLETRDRKHKKISQLAKMQIKFKDLQDMKKSRELIGFIKNQGQNH